MVGLGYKLCTQIIEPVLGRIDLKPTTSTVTTEKLLEHGSGKCHVFNSDFSVAFLLGGGKK